MSKAQRIRAIQQLADHLYDLPTQADALLVLRQYDAQIPSGWGHLREMLLGALDSLPDGSLFQMTDDLLSPDHAMSVSASEVPWSMADHVRIFISHSSTHRKLMGQLRNGLRQFGVDAFVAHDTIAPTAEWERVILAALDTCDALVAWLTPEFLQSRWTDQEVGYALSREVPILPIKAADHDPHGFIAKFQAVVTSPTNMTASARQVAHGLMARPTLGPKMLNVALQRFEKARSYDEARKTVNVLYDHPWPWTTETLDRLKTAPSKNQEIANAFGVSPKVAGILSRYR
jgi:hypothetical protein